MTGTLYVVATPIGNLEDMTPRAVRILGEVDLIAAEDTRHSRGLLTHFNLKTPMFSCHKFNEEKRGGFFVDELLSGKNIALISDAGTPCISDPGDRLVRAAAAAGIDVIAVCGASAVVAALSVSGFDVTRFTFVGFLPRGKDARKFLAQFDDEIVVFFESPRRIKGTLSYINEIAPLAQICLCNDISKKFERVYRGDAATIFDDLGESGSAEKGEYVCVVKFPAKPVVVDTISIEARLVDVLVKSGGTLKDASRILGEIAPELPKREIYAARLRLRELFG